LNKKHVGIQLWKNSETLIFTCITKQFRVERERERGRERERERERKREEEREREIFKEEGRS